MASSPDRLTSLQRDLLRAFFEHERGFFLTGGAALSGFYLHHRETTDLDFLTHDRDAFDRGVFALRAAVDQVNAEVTIRQEAPGFRRALQNIREEVEAGSTLAPTWRSSDSTSRQCRLCGGGSWNSARSNWVWWRLMENSAGTMGLA